MEILIWIGFLIVYSIVQSLGKKKKKGPSQPTPSTPGTEGARQPTLQDALREIRAALEGNIEQTPPVETSRPPATEAKTLPEKTVANFPSKSRIEPEFHSLEKSIPDRQLETKTEYSTKIYTKGTIEKETTYEDSFPESSFYDDNYQHPHMDDVFEEAFTVKKEKSPAAILRQRLNDGNYLSEAFVLQQILGEPASKKRKR